MTNAAITPGTHPHSHNKNTMKIEPQPLSITAKGGQIIESKTLQKLMVINLKLIDVIICRQSFLLVTQQKDKGISF